MILSSKGIFFQLKDPKYIKSPKYYEKIHFLDINKTEFSEFLSTLFKQIYSN